MFPIDPMKSCGMTGRELAKQTGYSAALVSMLLNGKRLATIQAALKFHLATGGKISMEQLRPDVIAAMKTIGLLN